MTKQRGKYRSYNLISVLLVFYLLCIAIYNPQIVSFNFSNFILLSIMVISALYVKKAFNIDKALLIILLPFYLLLFLGALRRIEADGISLFTKLSIPLCLYLILSKFFKSYNGLKKLTILFTVANICACITGIIYYYIFRDSHYLMLYKGELISRMTGSFIQANVFACFVSLTLPFGIYVTGNKIKHFKSKEGRGKWQNFINILSLICVIIINSLCIIMSRSRWSIVSLAVLAMIWTIRHIENLNRQQKTRDIIMITVVVVALLIFIQVNSSSSLLGPILESRISTEYRFNGLQEAFKLFLNNPIIGYGLGYKSVIDSTIINLLLDIGFPGLFLFVFLCSRTYNRMNKKVNKGIEVVKPFVAMFIVLMVEMIAESVLYNSLLNIFFGCAWFIDIVKT